MKLYIIGKGGHARVVSETASLLGFEVRYVVRDPASDNEVSEELILDNPSILASEEAYLICGVGSIGSTEYRKNLLQRYRLLSNSFISIVHPSAYVSRSARIGKGIFVAMGAIVGTNVVIEDHAILNSGCIVDHDCIIGTGTHLATGCILSGSVHVGAWSHIGTGAKIIQGIIIAQQAVVGAGATVVRIIDLPATTWAGTPAKQLRPNS
jgi:sugar O-acyltransferase (sialic acid O-acetyltransferase NeuD family)